MVLLASSCSFAVVRAPAPPPPAAAEGPAPRCTGGRAPPYVDLALAVVSGAAFVYASSRGCQTGGDSIACGGPYGVATLAGGVGLLGFGLSSLYGFTCAPKPAAKVAGTVLTP